MASGAARVAYDRVAERRRAVALPRHFREAEGLSHEQIAERLVDSGPTTRIGSLWGTTRMNRGQDMKGRGTVGRAPAIAAVCLAIGGGLAGCGNGGEEAGAGAGVVIDFIHETLPRVGHGGRWIGGTLHSTGSLAQAATGLGTGILTVTRIQDQMERIVGSDSPVGEALVTATCQALSTMNSDYQNDHGVIGPDQQHWITYLQDALKATVPNAELTASLGKVSGFVTAAQLDQISPADAHYYVTACILGGR
jgi:hypothetical protein